MQSACSRHNARSLIVHRLGDDRKSGFFARPREQLQAFLTESLERVRRAAWLECAAAKRRSAGLAHQLGSANDLLFRFHGAWSGYHGHVLSAERNAGCDRDDGGLGPPFARHLLVRLRDVNDLHDAGKRFDPRGVDASVVADESDGRALRARHRLRVVAHLLMTATTRSTSVAVASWRMTTSMMRSISVWRRTACGVGPFSQSDSSRRRLGLCRRRRSAIASSTAGPRMRTLTMDDTPGSCIVTP